MGGGSKTVSRCECLCECVCVKEDVRVEGGSKIQFASVSACVSVSVKEGGRKSRNEVSKCECLCVRVCVCVIVYVCSV